MSKPNYYDLLFRFEDQSPSFVHGFEAGEIHQKLKSGLLMFEQNIHTLNTDLVKEMCCHYGYEFNLEVCRDEDNIVMEEWMFMKCHRQPELMASEVNHNTN